MTAAVDEDILDMVDKTADEFRALDDITGGEVHIGCAESFQIKYLAQTIKEFKQKYPLFRYHLTSGNTEQVTERLDRGLIDFAVIVEPPNLSGTINLCLQRLCICQRRSGIYAYFRPPHRYRLRRPSFQARRSRLLPHRRSPALRKCTALNRSSPPPRARRPDSSPRLRSS